MSINKTRLIPRFHISGGSGTIHYGSGIAANYQCGAAFGGTILRTEAGNAETKALAVPRILLRMQHELAVDHSQAFGFYGI